VIRSRTTIRITTSGSTGTGTSGTTGTSGSAGRVAATIFFLFWLGIPAVILVVLLRDVGRTLQTWRWPAIECTIVRSGVRETDSRSDPKYAFDVEYEYAAGGASDLERPRKTGTVYALRYKGDTDYAKAQRLALTFPVGTKATCYVNPDNPADAVLRRNSPWFVATVLFPLLFIAIGAGGLYYTWRRKPAATAVTPLSSKAATEARGGAWALVLFCAAFAGCGGIVSSFLVGRLFTAVSSRSWVPVPAVVESSRVRSHSDSDSTTYSPDVLYRYEFNGREYRSNRYDIMGGSSGGYDAKRRIVDGMPRGARVTAFVNPADPTRAVIVRGFTWDMLVLAVPVLFVVGGLLGVFFSLRAAVRKRYEAQMEAYIRGDRPALAPAPKDWGPVRVPAAPGAGSGPLTLKPATSPLLKLLGMTALALFWNGIVSVFLWQVVKGYRNGRAEVCLTVFLIPFVLVGLGLVWGAFYTLLALFNPRAVLVLDRAGLALGEAANLRWALAGRAERVHRLVLRVVGREEATYRRGTDTVTDRSTFLTLDLVDTTDPAEINEGRVTLTVPKGTMHSLVAPNNKITWSLEVHGHIHGWPDVKDQYPLAVAPLRDAGVGAAPTTTRSADAPREATWTA
jgi:hypothetical protein